LNEFRIIIDQYTPVTTKLTVDYLVLLIDFITSQRKQAVLSSSSLGLLEYEKMCYHHSRDMEKSRGCVSNFPGYPYPGLV